MRMVWVMWLAATVAGLIHVAIFLVESMWWTTPAVRHRFRQSAEQAEATRLMAFNQGFYNLFLALGTFAGLALTLAGHPGPGLVLDVVRGALASPLYDWRPAVVSLVASAGLARRAPRRP